MKFTKMEGIGNDYVYVNCFTETVHQPEEVAKYVSDRHFGIGSDGLILIKPSKVADFEMAIKKLVHHFGKRVVYKEIRTELLGSKQAVKILVDGMCLTDLLFIEDEMRDCRYTMRADDDAVTIYQHTTVMGGTFGFQVSKDLWQGILPLDGQLHQNLQQILHNNPRLLVSAERYLARQYGDSPSHHSSS